MLQWDPLRCAEAGEEEKVAAAGPAHADAADPRTAIPAQGNELLMGFLDKAVVGELSAGTVRLRGSHTGPCSPRSMLGLGSQVQSSQRLLPFLSPHFSRAGCLWLPQLDNALTLTPVHLFSRDLRPGRAPRCAQVTLGQLWMLCERNPLLNNLQKHSRHNLTEIRGAVAEVSAQQL